MSEVTNKLEEISSRIVFLKETPVVKYTYELKKELGRIEVDLDECIEELKGN